MNGILLFSFPVLIRRLICTAPDKEQKTAGAASHLFPFSFSLAILQFPLLIVSLFHSNLKRLHFSGNLHFLPSHASGMIFHCFDDLFLHVLIRRHILEQAPARLLC